MRMRYAIRGHWPEGSAFRHITTGLIHEFSFERIITMADEQVTPEAEPEPEPGTVAYAVREWIKQRAGIAQRFPLNAGQANEAIRLAPVPIVRAIVPPTVKPTVPEAPKPPHRLAEILASRLGVVGTGMGLRSTPSVKEGKK